MKKQNIRKFMNGYLADFFRKIGFLRTLNLRAILKKSNFLELDSDFLQCSSSG